jgi:hypothetical protein
MADWLSRSTVPAIRPSISATGIKSLTTRFPRSAASTNRDPSHGSDTKRNKEEEGSTMKKFGIATVAASALAAALIGLAAPVQAAPAGPGNAEQTISELQSQGYTVIINRIGTTPLNEATVVAVRPGQTYTQTDSMGVGHNLNTRVVSKTVYVDVQ